MTARSEAIKRNRKVLVTPAAGGWQEGWKIVNPDASEPDILEHAQSGSADIAITVTGSSVGFSPSGRAAEPVTFTVIVGSGTESLTRCLKLKPGGYMDDNCA
ncbi:GspH/FimT family protein [Kineobactrum sediminis]|nr:GspH/FimT family protein [Kineobactrum sediminis]